MSGSGRDGGSSASSTVLGFESDTSVNLTSEAVSRPLYTAVILGIRSFMCLFSK